MATKAARRPKPRRIDGGEQSPQSTKPLLLPTTNGCPRRPTDSPGRRFSLRSNHRFSRERRENFHPAEDPTIIAAGITPAKRRRKIKEGEKKGWRVVNYGAATMRREEESSSWPARGQIFTPARVAKLEGNRFEMTFHLTGHKRWRRV